MMRLARGNGRQKCNSPSTIITIITITTTTTAIQRALPCSEVLSAV